MITAALPDKLLCDEVLSTKNAYKWPEPTPVVNSYNYGESINAGSNSIFAAPMYIKNLETGERFELFSVKQHIIYDYEAIMKQFVKIVKKNYEIKK